MPGIGYKRNVCIKRYFHDWVCAKQMLSILKTMPSIDIIVCANQNVAAAFLASQYAKQHSIPFLFDLRDPWPDAFPYAVKNKILKGILKIAIKPDQFLVKQTLKRANSIVSMSQDMLHWGLKKIPHLIKSTKIFYLSTTKDVVLTEHQKTDFSKKHTHWLNRKTFKCFYISKWGINFQPTFLLKVAAIMANEAVDFIICGDGDYREMIYSQSEGLSNVYLPGFLSHEEAYFIAKHCDCGIVFITPESIEQFRQVTPTFPNKAFFHFMCGLPLLNGMPGELATIVETHHLGYNFLQNDLITLRKLILKLKGDPRLQQEMGQHSRMFFEQYGNPEHVYSEYAQFVNTFCQ